VGLARTALFNWAFARHHGGTFVFRIEDTDAARDSQESYETLLEVMRWLGFSWDEGPEVGGPHGPYRQSERFDIYADVARRLLEAGRAYHCYCSQEELDERNAQARAEGRTPGYDGHCRDLSEEQATAYLQDGRRPVVRFRMPDHAITFDDLVRGEITFQSEHVPDYVLVRGNGHPLYTLVNPVDDALMEITHVLRGEEWLPSAPKLIKLYEYFGWEQPKLCYMPLLRNPDKSKLSKRKNPTCITFYERMGFMPEALLNYLGRMGWSMPDEREKFSLAEMIEHFDLSRVSLGGPIFDIEKLSWLNGQWLRELPVEEFARRVQQWAFNPQYLMQIAPHVQQRVETFSDIAPLSSFFFSGGVQLDAKLLEHKKLTPDQVRQALQLVLWELEALRQWDKEKITGCIQFVCEGLGLKLRDLMPLIFPAITGKASSVSVLDAMEILGADLSRFRLRQAVELLGGVSNGESKEWKKLLESFR
ncbi:MAG: glutamate--tRNA ligase, partial [Gammaproteobacteria bacterium]|nr:glutamate--tRNA ligase [Gammaproteobacteria bacterium]MDX5374535.1 glutamate--tRNA ligase [Gammaproteobacteria bacterium]